MAWFTTKKPSDDGGRRSRTVARAGALLAGATLAASALVGAGSPALAEGPTTSDALVFVPYNGQTFTVWRNGNVVQPVRFSTQQVIEGNFSSAGGTDLFLYNQGSGSDGILHVTPSGTTSTTSFRPESVSGAYRPLVGDFDANGVEDIFWYAPGSSPDSIWLFQPDGSHTTKSQSVTGSYQPTVTEASADGYDDIIWYAPGTAADSIWLFGAGAGHTTKTVTINGSYQLITGYFGFTGEGEPGQRVVFFNPSGPDSIWTFDTDAGHTSAPLPNVDGAFVPVVGNYLDKLSDQILYYRPGAGSERFVGFTDDGTPQQYEPPSVYGDYDPSVGDFDGNGYSDIAWSSGGKATLWKFNGGGYSTASIVTNTVNTITATARYDIPEV